MLINRDKTFAYRITHRDNLAHILEHGLLTKHHPLADQNFVAIGNPEIIDVRSSTLVKLDGYGVIGDYVPFYFTSKSIMLFNIVTGYYEPKVPRRSNDEIIVIRCLIDTLSQQPQWFFTDGQANDVETNHYNDLTNLDGIDWDCIQQSNFRKADGDYDRPRRYQAEFLVRNNVSVECIDGIGVYSDEMKEWVEQKLKAAGLAIPIHVQKRYFFD